MISGFDWISVKLHLENLNRRALGSTVEVGNGILLSLRSCQVVAFILALASSISLVSKSFRVAKIGFLAGTLNCFWPPDEATEDTPESIRLLLTNWQY